MHVLVLPSWFPTKDNPIAGVFFKEQAEALAKKNIKVGVFALNVLSIRSIINSRFKNIKYLFSPSLYIEKNKNVITYTLTYMIFPKINIIKKIQRSIIIKIFIKNYILNMGQPDVIHVHSYSAGFIAMYLKNKFKTPYIITEHSSAFARNILNNLQINYAKHVFANADYCCAVSNEFCKLLEEISGIKFNYIPNIVNVELFNIQTIKKYKKFTFLNIASLNENKNHSMLLDAFAILLKRGYEARLVIAGTGPLENELKEKVINLRIQNFVSFYGSASRIEVRNLMNKSHAFVLSSKYETFGVVLIEALSCGIPIIATKCGGPESIIIDNKIGELVDIDTSALATAMMKIYDNINKYNKSYIREYAIANFSEDAVISRLLTIYKDVINKAKVRCD